MKHSQLSKPQKLIGKPTKYSILPKLGKRGYGFMLVMFVIFAMAILIMLAGWLYANQTLTDIMVGLPSSIPGVNLSQAASQTFVPVMVSLNSLKWISFALIMAMVIGSLIANIMIRSHPSLFIVYIALVVSVVVFSAYVSNAYESVRDDSVLSDTLAGFIAMNYIVANLPWWTAVIGVIGTIFLVINLAQDKGFEGAPLG